MSFGERLKKARKAKKLTQEAVAARLDRDFTSVSKWENDKAEPDRETLIKLSELYDVPLSYLIGNMEERGYAEEEKEVLSKLNKAVPLKQIASEHEVEWDGKVLNEQERVSFFSFMDAIMKMRDEHKKK
jgi:transcriptional regulator with XRE-family HTH domain